MVTGLIRCVVSLVAIYKTIVVLFRKTHRPNFGLPSAVFPGRGVCFQKKHLDPRIMHTSIFSSFTQTIQDGNSLYRRGLTGQYNSNRVYFVLWRRVQQGSNKSAVLTPQGPASSVWRLHVLKNKLRRPARPAWRGIPCINVTYHCMIHYIIYPFYLYIYIWRERERDRDRER